MGKSSLDRHFRTSDHADSRNSNCFPLPNSTRSRGLSGDAQLKLARDVNEYAVKLRDEKPDHSGFFAALPSILSTEASLAELKYALDVLKADGVTLFTRYGD